LLGANVWTQLNHYLLRLTVDIGGPDLDLASVLPEGSQFSEIGSYEPLQSWPSQPAQGSS
jgi:hypothetical protein